ncbi:MAG: YdeI/OmpD-associated family protein [archaeon]
MRIGETLYVKNRASWRSWLAKNRSKASEIWLVYYRKSSGRPRIAYNAAVEEALCFGWIDSTVKKVDAESFAQRFSPRRPGSVLSQMNRERIHRLVAAGRMTRAGLAAVAHAYRKGEDKRKSFKMPSDILAAIKKNPAAWMNFRKLPAAYVRIRISYINDRRGPESSAAFKGSLENFIRKTAEGKRFGLVRD